MDHSVDRYLDDLNLARLERDRRVCDMEGYRDHASLHRAPASVLRNVRPLPGSEQEGLPEDEQGQDEGV